MNKECYILGVGGSSALFIELAEACGYKVSGLYHYNDTRTGEMDHGYRILGSFDDLYRTELKGVNIVLSMGDMNIRMQVTEKLLLLGAVFPTLIHPTAIISRFSNVSTEGVMIGAGCIIQSDVNISSHSVIRDMALVCHQTIIGRYCFVGPKALVGAHVTLSDLVFVGQGAIVVSGKVPLIGEGTIIGAGSIVTKTLPALVLAVGSPAKPIKQFKKLL